LRLYYLLRQLYLYRLSTNLTPTSMNTFNNPQVKALPEHLKRYIVDQNYDKYTWIDQAVWRYVMRQNYSYLKSVAYYPYIKGLEQAGLSIERIPDLQTINDNLGLIGWGAVTVDGFIPPSAFMEYQEYKVLVIAADIRQLKHIEYTPAPDIIHESAGHAPIIADKDYNNYLSYFGSIGVKAMFSAKDFELYEAIRHLSILKETLNADPDEIKNAELKLQEISENMGEPSEMALLSRLHWWTVEYGLIGTLEDPKIYGAGLLSSIGESNSCMQPEVKKIWYTIDTINYPYDITKPQPQLFVTPTFQNLIDVLEEFADTMAFRTGGISGIKKAIECKNVTTAQFSSGLQVTGVFSDYLEENGISYVKTTGPSALSFDGKQLDGHSKDYHSHGYSSPVGNVKGATKPLEDYSEHELESLGIKVREHCEFMFESGIRVEGRLDSLLYKNEKLILLTFSNCTVKTGKGETLFLPEWGAYDMAVGGSIVSVFNGAADKTAFEGVQHVSDKKPQKVQYDEKVLKLHKIYGCIREIRESNQGKDKLYGYFEVLKDEYPEDWLASLEIYEILKNEEILNYLNRLKAIYPQYKKLIEDGLFVMANT
jgi:phenylalanine-4-hydroxylase